jgi:hypothetical protein
MAKIRRYLERNRANGCFDGVRITCDTSGKN